MAQQSIFQALPTEIIIEIIRHVGCNDLITLYQVPEFGPLLKSTLCFISDRTGRTPQHEVIEQCFRLARVPPSGPPGALFAIVDVVNIDGSIEKLLALNAGPMTVHLCVTQKNLIGDLRDVWDSLSMFKSVELVNAKSLPHFSRYREKKKLDLTIFSFPSLEIIDHYGSDLDVIPPAGGKWSLSNLREISCSQSFGGLRYLDLFNTPLKSLSISPNDMECWRDFNCPTLTSLRVTRSSNNDGIPLKVIQKLHLPSLYNLTSIGVGKFDDIFLGDARTVSISTKSGDDANDLILHGFNSPNTEKLTLWVNSGIIATECSFPSLGSASIHFETPLTDDVAKKSDFQFLNKPISLELYNANVLLSYTPLITSLTIKGDLPKSPLHLPGLRSLTIHETVFGKFESSSLFALGHITTLKFTGDVDIPVRSLFSIKDAFPVISTLLFECCEWSAVENLSFPGLLELRIRPYKVKTFSIRKCDFPDLISLEITGIAYRKGRLYRQTSKIPVLSNFSVKAPELKKLHIERFHMKHLKIVSHPELKVLEISSGLRCLTLDRVEGLESLSLTNNRALEEIITTSSFRNLKLLEGSGTPYIWGYPRQFDVPVQLKTVLGYSGPFRAPSSWST